MLKRIKVICKRNNIKKKKGFTLVELLAVIVILAIIMIITIPTVLGSMNNSKQKAFDTVGQTMKKYLVDNYNNCKLGNTSLANYDTELFSEDCSLKDDISTILIEKSGYSTDDIKEVEIVQCENNFLITASVSDDGKFSGSSDVVINDVSDEVEIKLNKPDLLNGLVPIIYRDNNWYITSKDNSDWYDYGKQKWANAALLKSGVTINYETPLNLNEHVVAMFVWIPRFSYTIGCLNSEPNTNDAQCYGYRIEGDTTVTGAPTQESPGAIDIKFVSACTKENPGIKSLDTIPRYKYTDSSDRTPTKWYTHPAFTFGNKELTGIWVGKFHTGINSNEDTVILPNVRSYNDKNVYNQFLISRKFTTEDKYALGGNSHMMKDSEYGAVAYLSQSEYGKYGNRSYNGENKEIYYSNSIYYGEDGFYTGISSCRYGDGGYFSVEGDYDYEGNAIRENLLSNILCGTGASSNGDITGVYDLSGGAFEVVMSKRKNKYGSGGDLFANWFEDEKNKKYYNEYTNKNITYSLENYTSNFTQGTGTATYETAGWYNDRVDSLTDGSPWLKRGHCSDNDFTTDPSSSSGVFAINSGNGAAHKASTFRIVLTR